MLTPRIRWDKKLEPHWDISESGAKKQLALFLKDGLGGYKEGRNFPGKAHASRLSPYLHSGEISPNQVWHAANLRGDSADIDNFCSELGWREFSYSLLHHFPALPHENWQKKFDHFPWKNDREDLSRWKKGMTGYPIVDAGMRELWQTGYMHNRVRMIVASFLIKNLLVDWRHGARWFWDCLVDADLANNSASWQWVAGSGADAAPYFRIFNPIGQGEKFDGDGAYTRKYVPELAKMPEKYLFQPWKAPNDVLSKAGVILGRTYPSPIVDIALSRAKALQALAETKAV
jgi:deoxyribodipyrimidine photo-lyase